MSDRLSDYRPSWTGGATAAAGGGVVLLTVVAVVALFTYFSCKVEVPASHVAVLIKKTGADLPTDVEIAPDATYKGVQLNVLKEGRTYLNPMNWEWEILPQVEVPTGKVGVVVRLFGDDLPHQQLLATTEKQKGIVSGALKPGRYPDFSNPYAYRVLLSDEVTVPAGFKGVVTLVTGQTPKTPNTMLVKEGERGVQEKTLDAGTHPVNPFEQNISLIDCRIKKLDLSEEKDMGFPSRDGFWIRLDGTIQFHIIPERAAEVFVTYNDAANGDELAPEIVESVILPNARAFCRLAGSRYSGRQFIEGKAREEFQQEFHSKMVAECEPNGVAIDAALITKIAAPEPIAQPVRQRETAKLKQNQFHQEITQQLSEAKLMTENMKKLQLTRLVDANREVVELKTKAEQDQKVQITEAQKELEVAKRRLEAAKDLATAITAKGTADAKVINLKNEAQVSGQRAAVAAYDGNGFLYAQQVLYQKLAPTFKQIMVNSSDSPIMKVFENFHNVPPGPSRPFGSNQPTARTGGSQ